MKNRSFNHIPYITQKMGEKIVERVGHKLMTQIHLCKIDHFNTKGTLTPYIEAALLERMMLTLEACKEDVIEDAYSWLLRQIPMQPERKEERDDE